MDPKKTGIEYDASTQRYFVYYEGSVVHRSKTKEAAEKTLSRMQNYEAEDRIRALTDPQANPANLDPFAKAEDTKVVYDIEAMSKIFGSDLKTLIPKHDKNFVPFGNFKDLETIISSGLFYPAYVSGPTGNGKSTMVEQICAKHKKPLIRINLNVMVDEEVLIGSKTLKNGDVEIVEGPVLIAMRTGATLLLDEVDAGAANTLLCLQPILEGKPYYFKLKNEIVTPAPGFNVIASANTKGKGSDDGRYIGTNVLNEAFLERFAVTFNQEYPAAMIENKIIVRLLESYGIEDNEFATTLTKWAESVRKSFDDGAVDETITTRRIGHVVRAYAVFRNKKKAIELCCNRFDQATKNAFIELFDKLTPVPQKAAAQPAPRASSYSNTTPF
jgi:hypothetical protein